MANVIMFNGRVLYVTGYLWGPNKNLEGRLIETSMIAPTYIKPYHSKPFSSREPRKQRPKFDIVK